MHEMDFVRRIAEAMPSKPPRVVRIKLGQLQGVAPEVIDFHFKVLAKDTALENTTLEFEIIKAVFRCEKCGNNFEDPRVEDLAYAHNVAHNIAGYKLSLSCPQCKETKISTVSGEEFEINPY